MEERKITAADAGQRLDKYIKRILPEASASFPYKMLRKKNITVNGRKADGSLCLQEGDVVSFYLSADTFTALSGKAPGETAAAVSGTAGEEYLLWQRAFAELPIGADRILYEDAHFLILDKPQGILSQRSSEKDLSVCEWLRGYLAADSGADPMLFSHYRPSVCNRLDRNTGGIILCAKTDAAARQAAALIRTGGLEKEYALLVHGALPDEGEITGYLKKDGASNTVTFSASPKPGAKESRTLYRCISRGTHASLAKALLITGRPHQLRVHFASIGHPVVGDRKYGDPIKDRELFRSCPVPEKPPGQFLYCVRITFPHMDGVLSGLSGKMFSCGIPRSFSIPAGSGIHETQIRNQ